MIRLILVATVLAIAATPVLAHGSIYRGPTDEVPPNLRRPTDPPPPQDSGTPTPPPEEDPGGTPTPSDPERPDAPPAGNPNGNGPRSQPGIAPGTGGRGGGTPTPEGRGTVQRPVVTFDSWLFWWAYNGSEILDLRARLRHRDDRVHTERAPIGFGEAHGRTPEGKISVTDLAIRDRVVPALEAALDPKLHFDIRAGAVIALGKIAATQEPAVARRIAGRLLTILANEGGREHVTVEESAALALGLTQTRDPEVVEALCRVLGDRRGGRVRTRAFAALALGLLGVDARHPSHELVVETLRAVVRSNDEAHADVPACALLAMGLSGDRTYVPALVEMVKEGRVERVRKLDDLLRSYASSALGKIAEQDPGVADDVVDVLKRALTRDGVHTPRSAVIALGQVASLPSLSADVRRSLVAMLVYVSDKGESMAANFAAVALGRIAASTDDVSIRNHVSDVLRRAVTKGSTVRRPFAALGLGLLGRGPGDAEAIVDLLRKEFDEYRGDPRGRGAYAIALGMVGDRRATPPLLAVLRDRGAFKKLRGFCAVALGMIRDPEAAPAIREALLEEPDPDLRTDAAIGAGLVGDRRVIDDLIAILRDPRSSLYVQGSVVMSLGRIGDERAVDPLLEMLRDPEAQDLNRALAACALGLLGDRNDVPVMSRLSKDVNYRAQVNSIIEVLTIF